MTIAGTNINIPGEGKALKNGKSHSFVKGKPLCIPRKRNKRRFYIVITLILICYLGYYLYEYYLGNTHTPYDFLNNVNFNLSSRSYLHCIVIDAGSTGSRLLYFRFICYDDKKPVEIDQEYYWHTKPGLSSYANNISGAKDSLDLLVQNAKRVIPEKDWANTSLIMKATAGLRLLPEEKANALLNESFNYLNSTGFKVENGAVSIMNGSDEGIFSWFTVNFLLRRIQNKYRSTVATLDMGGGSSQLTFEIPKYTYKNETEVYGQNHTSVVKAFLREVKLYSRSYLGLGLNEARRLILMKESINNSTNISSSCMNPSAPKVWNYRNTTYNITGPEHAPILKKRPHKGLYGNPVVNLTKCQSVIREAISHFEKPPSLYGHTICGFSCFYDKVADAGLLPRRGDPYATTLNILRKVTQYECDKINTDDPFMCLDLAYIITFLKDMCSITDSYPIYLIKVLDHHEISWAMGAAFFELKGGTREAYLPHST